jgi:hypothetical protein
MEERMRIPLVRMVVALVAGAALLLPAGSAGAGPPAPDGGLAVGPVPAAVGLTVTGRHAFLGDAAASIVLVGQYSCGPFPSGVPDRGVVDMSVTQRVNRVDVTGFGYMTPTVCDGNAQWYAVELVAQSGGTRFVRGTANWSASGYVEGPGGVQNVHVPPTAIRVNPA